MTVKKRKRPKLNKIHPSQHPLCLILAGRPDLIQWSTFLPLDGGEQLLACAKAEGLEALLFHTLRTTGCLNYLSPEQYNQLQRVYHQTSARNLLIYYELRRMLTMFYADANTPSSSVIVLKGAALAATLYPNIGLRPMSDVDLLLDEGQLEQAISDMEQLGYRPIPKLLPHFVTRLIDIETNFVGGLHCPLRVELHWGLIGGQQSRYRPNLAWFRQQSQSATLLNTPAMILNPSAHLLYLSAHLMLRHLESAAQLMWFYDIHLLLTHKQAELKWAEVMHQAELFNWTAALYTALVGVVDRFASPLPPGLLDSLAAQVNFKVDVPRHRREIILQGLFDTLSSLSWPNRFRLLLTLIFPQRIYLQERYQPSFQAKWSWILYYPYLWLRHVADWLFILGRLLRRYIVSLNQQTTRVND